MDLSLLTTQTVITFVLILFRISGLMVTAPVFNGRGIPPQVKIGLAFCMALVLFPMYAAPFVVPKDLIQFAWIAAQELAIGLLLGFVADLVFIALQTAGEFISIQMGLSMASVLDPITGIQVPVVGQVLFYFGLLLFLSINAHHVLILAVNHSFKVMPLGTFFDLDKGMGILTERMLFLTGGMIEMVILIAAPVMGILLISDVAMGFVAKVMPQMNIFSVSMPLKIALGLIILTVSIPYVSEFLIRNFDQMDQHLKLILK